ncbi:MAG: ATP-binding protein [Cyanobacteria bacterium MAG CAR3_bin_5]|nr:ATP-binding protein [Cyanobacteria bacterium MAG CAR3_bin_5]
MTSSVPDGVTDLVGFVGLAMPMETGMLHTLSLNGFRGFESYRLSGLARVNLLVGKNNSGKTSVLEAVELLVSEGNPRVLCNSLARRGARETRRPRSPMIDVGHVFHGHTCTPGVSFELSSDDGNSTLRVKILSLEEVGEEADDWDRGVKRWRQRRQFDPDEEVTPEFGMSIEAGASESRILLPVMEDGTVGITWYGYPRSIRNGQSGAPVHFLTLDAFDPDPMGRLWDTVLEKGIKAEIISDMRLLEPDLDSIDFRTQTNGILLSLHNSKRPLSINTYGDGTKRLLALRLSFVGAENGVLLVDEIDAGLHWTVMEEVWKLVIEVAKRLNVQVFAATHSIDCIQGLGSLLRNRPDLEGEVSLQRVTRSLSRAVCLQGDQIKIAMKQDIEVR